MKDIELGYEEAEVYFIEKELDNNAELLTEDIQEKIEKSVDLLNNYSVLGYKIAEITPIFKENAIILKDTAFELVGKDIYNHLLGCDKIYLFCATLGYGVDRIIRSFEVCDLSISYYLDTIAGLMIEKYCDFVTKVIDDMDKERDNTDRFSCGYGDFPLESQKDILDILNAEKELGIKLTDGGMMTPQKTVTAVIGAGKYGEIKRCELCVKQKDCDERCK
jgi:hypothetical protein